MKLTSASTHALRSLLHIAGGKQDRPVASHVIAAAESLPERFLLKVLKPLVSARLLHSVRGPHGGYRLARPTERITLLDVIEAVDGRLQGTVPEVARGK